MTRPSVVPSVLAALSELVPARLRRRLDEEPALAESWPWTVTASALVVEPSADVSVRVEAPEGRVERLDQVQCTCLLAPRCLHITAVLLRLPLDEDQPEEQVAITDAPPSLALSEEQREAARQAWQAGAALLDAGANAAGLLLTGELLRAVHSCRETGLHRLAGDGLRLAQRLRDLHAERPEFRLGALAGDLADLLLTARQLTTRDTIDQVWVGTARRAYLPVGALRVYGLFSEAVVSAAGFAGVVTYVSDQNGRIWSLSDVIPGPPERCLESYASPIDLGDASLDHRSLARAGLRVQRATASLDGRLGAGRAVGAVRAEGALWTEEPLAALWRDSLEVQLDRALGRRVRAGSDLLFLRGIVQGVRDNALVVRLAGDVDVACLAASDHPELAYRSNLRLLGSAPGLEILLIGRVVAGRPRSLILLAMAPAGADRVNLGLDALQHAHLPAAASSSPVALPALVEAAGVADPLDALRRRVYQLVSGGRATVGPPAWSGIDRDCASLTGAQLGTGAQLLSALRAAASPEAIARAWLAAWTYHTAANTTLQRLSWSA